MDDMKQEFSGTKLEIIRDESESECLLWEGEVQLRLSENEKDIVAPLTIRQKDNCKDGSRLFDWTSGKTTIEDFSLIFSGESAVQAIKHPMNVLGGKSQPGLKNLKQFIKVGYTKQIYHHMSWKWVAMLSETTKHS